MSPLRWWGGSLGFLIVSLWLFVRNPKKPRIGKGGAG